MAEPALDDPNRSAPMSGAQDLAPKAARRATMRAILLGCLMIPANVFWVVRQERVLYGPYFSTITVFANVIFELFVLVALNAVLRRRAAHIALSQGELLTVYTMLAVSTGLAGLDGVGIVAQILPHGAWFGESNHWTGFLSRFPAWLVVNDRDVLKGHFVGHSSLYQATVVRAWIGPVLWWTAFFVTLLFVANCINALVRRQWADHERLTFPVIWLPLEMTDSGGKGSFFRNPVMWSGFALAALLSLWNGIAYLYPALPSLPIGITDIGSNLTTKPWSALGWLPVTAYPIAIGLGYLLPTDLLFSCWFFFIFWKFQIVYSSANGLDRTPDFPFINQQGFGGLMGLFAYYLYTGRRHYAAILRNAVRGRRDTGYKEALSDRAGVLGILAGLAALLLFWTAAGAALWVGVVFFLIYFATVAVVTRIRAELGPPVHDFHFMGPDSMLPRFASAGVLRPADMVMFTFGYSLTRAHRSDTMPVGLEGLQLARLRGIDAKGMFAAIMIAVALGSLSVFWSIEHQAYQLGAASRFNQGFGQGQEALNRLSSWMSGGQDARPNMQAAAAAGIGLATVLMLFALRLRFFGFPFHPIGYAVSSSWAINLVWAPLLVAWIAKSVTLRYGGLKAYKYLQPFFLGLVLGDCVMGSLWALLSLKLGSATYAFFGA